MGGDLSKVSDIVTVEDAYNICGNRFNENVYKRACNDGILTKTSFISEINTYLEKCVEDFFQNYSKSGNMELVTFLNMLRRRALFDRKSFRISDGEVLFYLALEKENTQSNTITYASFRSIIIPELAIKKEINVSEMLSQIMRVDGITLMNFPNKDPNYSKPGNSISLCK